MYTSLLHTTLVDFSTFVSISSHRDRHVFRLYPPSKVSWSFTQDAHGRDAVQSLVPSPSGRSTSAPKHHLPSIQSPLASTYFNGSPLNCAPSTIGSSEDIPAREHIELASTPSLLESETTTPLSMPSTVRVESDVCDDAAIELPHRRNNDKTARLAVPNVWPNDSNQPSQQCGKYAFGVLSSVRNRLATDTEDGQSYNTQQNVSNADTRWQEKDHLGQGGIVAVHRGKKIPDPGFVGHTEKSHSNGVPVIGDDKPVASLAEADLRRFFPPDALIPRAPVHCLFHRERGRPWSTGTHGRHSDAELLVRQNEEYSGLESSMKSGKQRNEGTLKPRPHTVGSGFRVLGLRYGGDRGMGGLKTRSDGVFGECIDGHTRVKHDLVSSSTGTNGLWRWLGTSEGAGDEAGREAAVSQILAAMEEEEQPTVSDKRGRMGHGQSAATRSVVVGDDNHSGDFSAEITTIARRKRLSPIKPTVLPSRSDENKNTEHVSRALQPSIHSMNSEKRSIAIDVDGIDGHDARHATTSPATGRFVWGGRHGHVVHGGAVTGLTGEVLGRPSVVLDRLGRVTCVEQASDKLQ